mgnify:CR=1 FL=1
MCRRDITRVCLGRPAAGPTACHAPPSPTDVPPPTHSLHCSMAAQVKYIWPIQQAVTDFGAQRKRLKLVRQQLGWRLLGCDLLECFEE